MTTDTKDVHPTRIVDAIRIVDAMVLKAARAYFIERWDETPEQAPEWWEACRQQLTDLMQTILTECGALECLEALEKFCKAETPEDWEQAESASASAIAKVRGTSAEPVYGSAPE